MITNNQHPSCRGKDGKFKSGMWIEGFELTATTKAKLRVIAINRAQTKYRHISVDGVVYPNLTQAGTSTGISPRSLSRYANSTNHPNIYYVTQ